ncbi:hypothetical protein RJ640_020046 [Escallonia rubra]|uniref:DOG1 domain-containing protein n=1 Tax=Escallonia rubra TaxID=112253 RepID=A0AA88RVX4_9ASTE|nr:hypothetical protein RJ640_020046 [Escallonia rubra]
MSKRTTTSPTSNHAVRSFERFFEGWLVRQEHYLDELNSKLQTGHESRDEDLKDLITRVLGHYQQYYEEKSRVANRDVFLVFAPTWFTPFERTFFWIAGFKPGLAFRMMASLVDDLSEEQGRRMDRLKEETKAEERELANELARIQESVAAPPMVELARRGGRPPVDGEIGETEDVIEVLRSAMEAVLGSADMLRTRTAERVAEILSPVQNVKFLAAATQLQLKIRVLGLQKEAERRVASRGW